MVIKNRKKFIKSILLITGIIVFANLLFANNSYSHQEIKYKTVAVVSGDSLWDIAKEELKNNDYYDGKDIRDIIEDIKDTNNLSNYNLKVGQTLEIPMYK